MNIIFLKRVFKSKNLNLFQITKKQIMFENLALKQRSLKRYSLEYIGQKEHFHSQVNQKQAHKVFIESHRGVNREEPENTLKAFKRAIDIECDSIEMDVWLTQDKIPIVIHGDENGNIDQVHGKINSNAYESVSKIILDNNEKIPKLEEVLRLCKDKIFLNLEMKDPNCNQAFEEVYKLIAEYNMQKEVQISSFNFEYWDVIKGKGLENNIEFGFLYDKNSQKAPLNIGYANKKSMINIWHGDVTKEIVDKAHENSIGVLAWFDLKDDETDEIISNLIQNKIDVICSNNPRNALRVRESIINKVL